LPHQLKEFRQKGDGINLKKGKCQVEKIRQDVLNLYEAQVISLKEAEIIWALINKADQISRKEPKRNKTT